jgi:hypothetical protein
MRAEEIQQIRDKVREIKTLLSNKDSNIMVVMAKLCVIENKLEYHLQPKHRTNFKCQKFEPTEGQIEIETR